jgi:hypothetical protein
LEGSGAPPARVKRQVEKYTNLKKLVAKTQVYRLKGSTLTKMTKREQRAYLKSLEKK